MQILDAFSTYSVVKERITVIGIVEGHNCIGVQTVVFSSLNAITQSVLNSASHEEAVGKTMVSSLRLGPPNSQTVAAPATSSLFLLWQPLFYLFNCGVGTLYFGGHRVPL